MARVPRFTAYSAIVFVRLLYVCFMFGFDCYGCVLSTQSRSGLWGLGTGAGNYAGHRRERGRVCARSVVGYALCWAHVHFSARARRSSRASRATPISCPRSPLPPLPAGALARPRAHAGAEPAAWPMQWLGLQRGPLAVHALCMQENGLALKLCSCCIMLMSMHLCALAAVAAKPMCV